MNSAAAARPRALQGYLLVLLAASLWATLGIIYKALSALGLEPISVAVLRAGAGGGVALIGALIFRPRLLRVERRGWFAVLVYGVLGVAIFYATYIRAILTAGAAISAVLLYTAPAWVALIAWRFLGERFTRSHGFALGLSLVGVVLVARVIDPAFLRLNAEGLLWGLLSGLTYGLWSILNKTGVRHNHPWTLQTYGLLIGAAALLPFQSFENMTRVFATPQSVFWLLALAAGPTIGASIAYASAVTRIPVSVASVIAMLEPVLAIVLAALFLGERLAIDQAAGSGLILFAVWLLRPRSGEIPA